VLPRLFASLQAPSEQVQIKSLYAMNCFSDQLGDDIIPYLPAMMQQLALMIQTGSLTVKENTVLAIASAAIAAGKVRACVCVCVQRCGIGVTTCFVYCCMFGFCCLGTHATQACVLNCPPPLPYACPCVWLAGV
jgi:hypothetical protein